MQEKWDCHGCGICCRGSIIPLSDQDLSQLRSQRWDNHPNYRNGPTVVPIRAFSKKYRLAHRSDGSCVFLNEKGLCQIHVDFGYVAKPTICRVFPLQLIPRDKDVALTIRRSCPSAAMDLGRTIQDHLPAIERLVNEDRLSSKPVDAPMLKAGEHRDWKSTRLALDAASQLLLDERYPPVRRLVHVLQFADLLEKAKIKSMSHEKLEVLIQTLAEHVAEESKPFFEDRRQPSGLARVFFRQIAVEFARLHPEYRPHSKWSQRLRMMDTGWRVFRGRGLTPSMSPAFSRVAFDDLEQPLGQIDPSIDRPLARLIETQSASYLYAMADRQGWSVADSLRNLAILFPVGLWLLRWASHGRAPLVEDMVNIVVALDRGQGFHSLNSSLHRWRLKILGSQAELERLVVWYSR